MTMQLWVGVGLVAVGVLLAFVVVDRQYRRLRAALEAAELAAAVARGEATGLRLRLQEQQVWIDRLERDLRQAHVQALGRNTRLFVN